MSLSPAELDELKLAKNLFDNPGLAAKLSNVVGEPIEKGLGLLPKHWNSIVMEAVSEHGTGSFHCAPAGTASRTRRGAASLP